ncbi:MAG TPA: hypothetical protein VEA35_00540 [Ramlibacter sp.]|nr:hypothetical protein [Ramlibacter sp.]
MRVGEETKRAYCRAMRWRQNPFAGLRWFTRDSGGCWVLVSRHWPHMLCWSWLVRLSFRSRGSDQRWWSAHRTKHNGGGGCWVRFGFGELAFHWQTYWIARNEAELLAFIASEGVAS